MLVFVCVKKGFKHDCSIYITIRIIFFYPIFVSELNLK
jgi:hypothetical protein